MKFKYKVLVITNILLVILSFKIKLLIIIPLLSLFFVKRCKSFLSTFLVRFLNKFFYKMKFYFFPCKNCFYLKNDRKEKIIISLTTYDYRIKTVYLAIESFFRQTVKADKIILWLDENEFDLKNIPKTLKEQIKKGLDVKFYHNIKSYKKLIPSLINFPDDIIITADDDFFYPKNFIEHLYRNFLKDNDKIYYYYGFKYIKNDLSLVINTNYRKNKKNLLLFPSLGTGAGVLFPPHIFDNTDILKENIFMNLIPHHDDIFISTICFIKKIKIKKILSNKNFRKNCKFFFKFRIISGTQKIALSKLLTKNDGELCTKEIKNIFKYYNVGLVPVQN